MLDNNLKYLNFVTNRPLSKSDLISSREQNKYPWKIVVLTDNHITTRPSVGWQEACSGGGLCSLSCFAWCLPWHMLKRCPKHPCSSEASQGAWPFTKTKLGRGWRNKEGEFSTKRRKQTKNCCRNPLTACLTFGLNNKTIIICVLSPEMTYFLKGEMPGSRDILAPCYPFHLQYVLMYLIILILLLACCCLIPAAEACQTSWPSPFVAWEQAHSCGYGQSERPDAALCHGTRLGKLGRKTSLLLRNRCKPTSLHVSQKVREIQTWKYILLVRKVVVEYKLYSHPA